MSRQFSHTSNQTGVALITVLLFLILIMIVGAIAVRQANVDLNVAASDQVATLLLSSSDGVLAHVEVAASGQDPIAYAEVMSQENGPLGYFATPDAHEKIGNQVSFCYRPNANRVFSLKESYIREPGNAFIAEIVACDASKQKDYNSKRNTSMTQLIMHGAQDLRSEGFDNAERGVSDAGTTSRITPRVQMNSVSVLPAMSDKKADVIKKCLGRPVGDAKKYGITDGNVNDCLRANNIPSTFVVEEGVIRDVETGGYVGTEINSPCETATGAEADNCKAALTGG